MSETNEFLRLTQEAQLLIQLVNRAARNQLYGSFSDRNPTLGKMFTCPYCELRERRGAHQCTAKIRFPRLDGQSLYARRRIVPRLTRKRPPLFLVHQLLVDIETGKRPDLNRVPEENLAKYVEALVLLGKKETARRVRNQQKLSRRINRG